MGAASGVLARLGVAKATPPGPSGGEVGSVRSWMSKRRTRMAAGVAALAVAASAGAALAMSGDDVVATGPNPGHKPNYLLPVGTLLSDGSLPKPALAGDRGTVGVPAGTAAAPTSGSGGDAAAVAVYRGGPGTLTPAGIATLAMQRGCSASHAVVATAIAMAESGGSPSAQGDVALMTSIWDWSAGLWQIRGLRAERDTGGLRDSIANQNAGRNAAAMYAISSGCTNWTPWSTYNTGAYEAFVTVAGQAVHYVTGYYDAHGHRYPVVAAPDPTAVVPTGGGANDAAGAVGAQSRSSKAAGGAGQAGSHAGAGASQPPANAADGAGGNAGGRPSGGSGTGAASGGSGGGHGGSIATQPAPRTTSTSKPVAPGPSSNPVAPVTSKLPLPKPPKTTSKPLPTKLPTSGLPVPHL